jgi:hypothetical protein
VIALLFKAADTVGRDSRGYHGGKKINYPSDTTDEQWQVLRPEAEAVMAGLTLVIRARSPEFRYHVAGTLTPRARRVFLRWDCRAVRSVAWRPACRCLKAATRHATS